MPRGAKSRMRRTETPKPIWIKFCMVVDITDVVTHTNFGDHRLRGFWVAGGQISLSPIDFHRRPYNTLTLPCECVIQETSCHGTSRCSGLVLIHHLSLSLLFHNHCSLPVPIYKSSCCCYPGQLGQLSLASLRGRLIEYRLRLG